MILRFLKLEWKQFFRSSYWQKSMALNMLMGFFAIYFLVSFLALGFGIIPILKEFSPDVDPLQKLNSLLIFWFLGDLIFRYLMQKLPMMNIKPLLILPIKKTILVHYVLGKSVVSFFNFLPLFAFIPISIMLLREDYSTIGVLGWLAAMISLTLFNNFINFLINKNNIAFTSIAFILITLITIQYFGVYDITPFFGHLFDSLIKTPLLAIVPLVLAISTYFLNFKDLKNKVYLDDAISKKIKEANTVDLSWADKLGDVSIFIKNDIRLIWRNKRTKTVFFMSFLFLFYGLLFFTQDTYNNMPTFLVFVCIFITGGFTLNYGQFIPAWDSSHYKMLMSQNIRYRKFLESKWVLMVVMTIILYFLSIPYIYFGVDKFLIITAGAIFNIGFNSLFLLYAGSFNRKRIDLNKSGFSNMQGTSATQFLIIIPIMGIPTILFFIFSKLIGFNAGVIAIAITGLIGILFKNYFMNLIEKKYLQDKYATIHAFDQK
ncbi:MAG: DUF5687 family protein [Flavobacteriaceae bacterium]|nr:DUF5687 family protein [Flavobacteriaceae bacterium]